TNERRNTTPAIFAYVWTDAARRVALPCRWAAVIADLLVVRSGALLCTRTTAGGWKRMRRSPRRPKCRRLSGHDRVAQHPRECACNDPVSLAVGQCRLCTCSIYTKDNSRGEFCNDTKVLLRVWFGVASWAY